MSPARPAVRLRVVTGPLGVQRGGRRLPRVNLQWLAALLTLKALSQRAACSLSAAAALVGASSDGSEKHKGNEWGWDGVLRKPVLNWEVPGAEMSLVRVIIWACRRYIDALSCRHLGAEYQGTNAFIMAGPVCQGTIKAVLPAAGSVGASAQTTRAGDALWSLMTKCVCMWRGGGGGGSVWLSLKTWI